MEFLRSYGYIIDLKFINDRAWVKKRWGVNLLCDGCGRTIYEGWTNDWNLYCDDCFNREINVRI